MGYDIFISYRRADGVAHATLVRSYLEDNGYRGRVFQDVRGLGPGPFPEELRHTITAAPVFVLILTKDCLDERIQDENDWLRKEISRALTLQRTIILLRSEDFEWPEELPEDIRAIHQDNLNTITLHFDQPDAALERLRGWVGRSVPPQPGPLPDSPHPESPPLASATGVLPRRIASSKWLYWLAALALIVVVGILAYWSTRTNGPPERDTSRYGFEDGRQGWVAQLDPSTRGCIDTAQTDARSKFGAYSLEMKMDLDGSDRSRQSGEAWVNWKNTPLAGTDIPTDFTNYLITAWVYAPQLARGQIDRPNGFQLFVKDENWRSLYGGWSNILGDEWVQISMKVDPDDKSNEYKDADFDPTRIVAIGVKMGIGDGSNEAFQGSVFIDAVDWAPSKPEREPNEQAVNQ